MASAPAQAPRSPSVATLRRRPRCGRAVRAASREDSVRTSVRTSLASRALQGATEPATSAAPFARGNTVTRGVTLGVTRGVSLARENSASCAASIVRRPLAGGQRRADQGPHGLGGRCTGAWPASQTAAPAKAPACWWPAPDQAALAIRSKGAQRLAAPKAGGAGGDVAGLAGLCGGGNISTSFLRVLVAAVPLRHPPLNRQRRPGAGVLVADFACWTTFPSMSTTANR